MQVIFDLDGTLFQTKYCDINAIHRLFDELNIERISEEKITMNIGKITANFLQCLLPGNINSDDVSERFRELKHEEIRERGLLFPNVIETLQQLNLKGHKLYVCSKGSFEYIELVLSSTGISKYFNKIFSTKYHKSKSDVVGEIVKSNTKTVVISDTSFDIDVAQINKIPSIAAIYGYGFKDRFTEALFNADKVEDIIAYISQLEVYFEINERLINTGKKIIGINGVDTSGKTQFAGNFSRFLSDIGIRNSVLHIDDYHNPISIRNNGKNEIDAYYRNAFNYRMVIEEVLNPLKENGCIDKNVICLNLDTDQYENIVHYDIDEDTILLIEGVLLFRPPLTEYFDGKIYLHIDFEEVINRARIRDVPKYGEAFLEKYMRKYIPIQKRYINEFNPEQNADIVVANQDYNNPRLL